MANMANITNMTNYYEILNVSKDATDVEIKRAFRRLSLEFHPDKSENKDNESKYKQIIEAYNILSDSEKRNLYNKTYIDIEKRLTRSNSKSKSNINSNTNINSRNHYYDRQRHYRSKHNYYNRNIIEYNSDHSDENIDDNIDNVIDMDNDIDNGMVNDIDNDYDNYINRNTYNRKRNYYYKQNLLENKSNNDFEFKNENKNENKNKNINNNPDLEDIRITRTITLEESYSGVSAPLNVKRRINDVEEEALVYVDIPEGTDNGEIIIMEGKGNIKGNYRSNIRVKVIVEQHLHFKRDKMNLVYNVDISLKEALCGFKREVTHLNGKQYMIGSERGKVVQQNSRRCIPNKGFQRGQNIGNLIINFNIVMPRSLSDEQIDILEKTLNN
jgi:DnaJ-class molecular chaperone